MKNLLREIITRDRFTILHEAKSANGNVMKVLVPWIESDTLNANGRIYPKALLDREISRVQKAVEEGSFIGTGDHPSSGLANLGTASHIVQKLWMDGKTGFAELKILPTERGKNVMAIIKEGGRLGISVRGFGTIDAGTKKVQDDYRLMGIDIVTNPSFKNATFSAKNIFESVDLDEQEEEIIEEPDLSETTDQELEESMRKVYEEDRRTLKYFDTFENWKFLNENLIRQALNMPPNQKLIEKQKEVKLREIYEQDRRTGHPLKRNRTFEQWMADVGEKIVETFGQKQEPVKEKEINPYPNREVKPADFWAEAMVLGIDPHEYAKKINERLNKKKPILKS